eukprot:scaffold317288_cov33-Tisochrysis_lutea.AAC.2
MQLIFGLRDEIDALLPVYQRQGDDEGGAGGIHAADHPCDEMRITSTIWWRPMARAGVLPRAHRVTGVSPNTNWARRHAAARRAPRTWSSRLRTSDSWS